MNHLPEPGSGAASHTRSIEEGQQRLALAEPPASARQDFPCGAQMPLSPARIVRAPPPPPPPLHLRRGEEKPSRAPRPPLPPSHAKPLKAEIKPGRPAPLPEAPGQPSRVTHAVSVVPAMGAGKRRSSKSLCTERHPRGCPASEGGGGG